MEMYDFLYLAGRLMMMMMMMMIDVLRALLRLVICDPIRFR